jgi:hypothetical protein
MVPAAGKGAGNCPNPTVLTSSAGYNLNNAANFYFNGNYNGTAVNNVAIGYTTACPIPRAKLDVFQNSKTATSVGAWTTNADPPTYCTNAATIGLYSDVTYNKTIPFKSNQMPMIAGFFNAPGGIDGFNCTPPCGSPMANFAIMVPNYSPNLGHYAPTNQYGGFVGIGVPYPYDFNCSDGINFVGSYFSSILTVNGSTSSGSYLNFSDSTLKKNITSLPYNIIPKIMSLRPVTFQWKQNTDTNSSGTHYGFIAQDVDTVFPNAVRHMGNGLYSLSYLDIVPILTQAIQQQQGELDTLKSSSTSKVITTSTGTLLNDSSGIVIQLPQIGGNSFVTSSDSRFKNNISSITNALAILENLNGVYFNWNQAAYPWKHFSNAQQVGLIAQQVNPYVPQVVTKDDSGYYAIDYGRLTPLLINALKQEVHTDSLQQQTIDSLRSNQLNQRGLMDSLRQIYNCISNLCHDTNRNKRHRVIKNDSNSINVSLSNGAILYQNTPNPFSGGGTKISYFLPENTSGATMVFFDMYGNKLQETQLTQTGMGVINLNPTRLSSGVYTYSLIINGTVVDTKKMVYQK